MTEAEWLKALEQRHGAELQQKFSMTSAAVCGLGGLGSNVAISLARAGLGTLLLIDFDRVDVSNLHRQQYRVSQLGMYKTEAMKQILSEISPYCKVITHTVKMTEENLSLIADCGIVCECFDSAECKAMLVNGVAERYPEKHIVSASGMSGLHTGNRIQTKRLGKRLLYPHPALVVLLGAAAAVLLAYSFIALEETDPLRIAAYVLAFCAMTLACIRIPDIVRWVQRFRQ